MVTCIWEDRGILLLLIEYIIDNYEIISKKNIVINDKQMEEILKSLFSKLSINSDIYKDNFYFNIRNIIKKQDVIIDYLNNYESISGQNIKFIPWSKRENLMIFYVYNENVNMKPNFENKELWDVLREKEILDKYEKFNPDINYKLLFNYLNTFFKNKFKMTGGHLIPIAVPISINNVNKNCESKNIQDTLDIKKIQENKEKKYIEIINILYKYIKMLNKIRK